MYALSFLLLPVEAFPQFIFGFVCYLRWGSHCVALVRPGTYYIDQDGLKLMKIHLPLPTK